MRDSTLIGTGTAGAGITAICCATPLLSVLLPLVGFASWLAYADLVLFPLLAASLGLVAWGIHRRRAKAGCCTAETGTQGQEP